jgi:tRNA threonylcarbamoyladenosine biosynthesis protein TsaB
MLIAVETSGMQGSIAIMRGDELIAERVLEITGPRHAQLLVVEVDRLLRELNLKPSEMRSVAVSIGPGSFTGLRVGLVFAKTFAWLHGAHLVAVDTLRAIAQQAPANHAVVTAVIDAQRGEVFAASYRYDEATGCREALEDVRVWTVDALPDQFPLTGPGLAKIRERLSPQYQILDASLWEPLASSVALLGCRMIEQQQFSVPETLEPVYVRLSYAEEKRDRPV